MPTRITTHRPAGRVRPVATTAALYTRRPARGRPRVYIGTRWRRLRVVLRRHPLCADCQRPAQHVHHKVDRKDAPDLAYEWSNLESQCVACHNRKRSKGIAPDPGVDGYNKGDNKSGADGRL